MSRGRVVVVVAIAALLGARYLTSISDARIDSYWIVNDATLGVLLVSGPQHSCWIDGTRETDDEVRITAKCREPYVPPLGSTAVGIGYCFDVRLAAPLGDRIVFDSLGNPVLKADPPNEGVVLC